MPFAVIEQTGHATPCEASDWGGAMSDPLDKLAGRVAGAFSPAGTVTVSGSITEVSATSVSVAGLSPFARLGDQLSISTADGPQRAEVAKIRDRTVVAVPYRPAVKARINDRIVLRGKLAIFPHVSWKGRVIDALASPIDNNSPLVQGTRASFHDRTPPAAMERQRIGTQFITGVDVVDVFTPLCFGQRVGIFAGSGVGKSTLLAMLSQAPRVDTTVIALVGERGREVKEFLDDALAGRRDHVVAVVATSDESAMMRRLAPQVAMTIAEYFRDRGENVLLMIDSLTRLAHAQREFALAAGEPPVARGYPPSVFTDMARLLERAGPAARGSITAIASVLVDGDDHNDPVSDAARGILDGHIVLDRKIASQGRYPAIDILGSISRLAPRAWNERERDLVTRLRNAISLYEDTRDVRMLSGHRPGSDPELDTAVSLVPRIYEFFNQAPHHTARGQAFERFTVHFGEFAAPADPALIALQKQRLHDPS